MNDQNNKMFSLVHRPKVFSDMVGQKSIINEFKNRSANNTFPQVMFMTGNSGSGKSSLSLIVAKLLNCINPVKVEENNNIYYDPCNNCESCTNINNESFTRDTYFLDASNMGKDDIIGLQQKVNIMPMYDKSKIIILDEAQELSKASKGATLKLLEKPRKNVYFILCTMDSNALISAIKSRGQVYNFKQVPSDEIAQYLWNILKKEGFSETVPEIFITEGLMEISSIAEGNVREATQILERCLYGNYYSKEEINRELGIISKEEAMEMLLLLVKRDRTFFESIKSIEIKDFFYITWKILTESNIYSITLQTEDWKKNSFDLINNNPEAYKLLEIYSQIYNNSHYYFNENYFLSLIVKFFKENPPVRMRRV